jgi:hypothetical protein
MSTFAEANRLIAVLRGVVTRRAHEVWWLSDQTLWAQELDELSMKLHTYLYENSCQVLRRECADNNPGWIVIPGDAELKEDALGVYNRLMAIVKDWNVTVGGGGGYTLPTKHPWNTLRPDVPRLLRTPHERAIRLDLLLGWT